METDTVTVHVYCGLAFSNLMLFWVMKLAA